VAFFDLLYHAVMLVICMSYTPAANGTADKVIMIYYTYFKYN